MMVSLDTDTATIRKVATTPAEAERLEREAAVLDVTRHPGIVQLRAAETGALEVAAVTGWCLADIGWLPPGEVAGLGAAVATILADLHYLGIVHGGLDASHVLIGTDRRPVVCSMGRARLPRWSDGPEPSTDVQSLVAILDSFLGPDPDAGHRGRLAIGTGGPCHGQDTATSDDVRRALRPRRTPLIWKRGPTAAQLADRLAAVPGATLPDPSRFVSAAVAVAAGSSSDALTPPRSSRPRKRGEVAVVVAGAVALAALAVGGVMVRRVHVHVSRPPACPPVDQGCRPVDHHDGTVVTEIGDFEVGDASTNPLVLGRWSCGPALPALLRLDGGEVWVWARWPSAGSVAAGRLAGRVDGAETLRVLVGTSGCDRLLVVRAGGATTTVPVNTS